MYCSSFLLAASYLLSGASGYAPTSGLRVDTTVGTVEGFIDWTVPGVKQWLGIPFAEPPVGDLRWKAPVAKTKPSSKSVIEAKTPPNDCQQFVTPGPSIFNTLVPQFNPVPPFSEDCLYLNVIAPIKSSRRKLPVLVWVHGGEAQWGGINTPYERPHKWVQRSQEHIVVQVNYRLNIFGFPNSLGLEDGNFGIQDIRMALEWVRDNIEQFGGDPEKIILWGQSAGSAACDATQFAWPSDPIFKGLILESGVILIRDTTTDSNKTSFSYVAQGLGAPSNTTAQDEVEYLRSIDASVIEAFLENNTVSDGPDLYFSAEADGKFFFTPEEYLAMGAAGQYANVPAILGSNAQEGSSFVPFSVNGSVTPAMIHAVTDKAIQCPVATTSQYRETSGRLTYRYFYAGNFTNISPVPWVGAYHFAELPLVMGTHSDYRGESTDFEFSLSHKMQDLWLAFANNPWNGLDWNPYSANGTALVLGQDGILTATEEVAVLDAGVCG